MKDMTTERVEAKVMLSVMDDHVAMDNTCSTTRTVMDGNFMSLDTKTSTDKLP
jgi:hypothetical protein